MNNLTKNYIERKEEFEKEIKKNDSIIKVKSLLLDTEKHSLNVDIDISKLKQLQKSDILSVLDVIEKWGEEIKMTRNDSSSGGSQFDNGYDLALSDLLQFVKEAKDEIRKEI